LVTARAGVPTHSPPTKQRSRRSVPSFNARPVPDPVVFDAAAPLAIVRLSLENYSLPLIDVGVR
jgi:hypothetical protein